MRGIITVRRAIHIIALRQLLSLASAVCPIFSAQCFIEMCVRPMKKACRARLPTSPFMPPFDGRFPPIHLFSIIVHFRLFSQMDLPPPRRPFRAAPRHADCTNGSAYGVGARSAPRRAPEYPLEPRSGAVRDERMERVVAAVTVSNAIVGARDRERLGPEPQTVAFASDTRMLGVGTSMRGSGEFAAPVPEGYPEQGSNSSNTIRAGPRSAHSDSDQVTGPSPTGTLARTPPLRLTDGATGSSQTAPGSSAVSSSDNPLSGQTPSWVGADRNVRNLAPAPARGQFPIAAPSTGWDPRQAEIGYHGNRSADAGEHLPAAQAGRSSPGIARTPPAAAAFGSAEQWDGVELGRGEYGRGVSGRP